ASEPEHPPQLKGDERGRNDLPGMVEMLERKAEAGGQAAHARPRKEPQMLRRRHEPPARAGEPRGRRAEISRRNDDDAAAIEMIAAQRENLARLRQMFEHIEQDDDVDLADAL